VTAPTRATITAPWTGATAGAMVRWTATETTIRDADGRQTVLRHATDVDRLALRRLPVEGHGNVWTLDLMLGDSCQARLQAPPWELDRDYGPAQAAAVSGLPLDQRPARLPHDPVPVDPAATRPWQRRLFLLAVLGTLGVLTLVVVPALRDSAWFIAAAGALALPFLVLERWPRRRRGQVLYRPRPSVPMPRGFVRRGAVVRDDDLLTIRTGGWSTSLPLPSDACGPRLLQRVSTGEDGSGGCEVVELRDAGGRTLFRFRRQEWCAKDADHDLAEALGVAHDRRIVPPGTNGVGTRADGAIPRDNLPHAIASLPGVVGLPMALLVPGDSVAALVAVLLTGAVLALGLVGEVVSLVVLSRRRALVPPPTPSRSDS
jgi:hypothetical protein